MVRLTGDPATLMSDYPGAREEDLHIMREEWGLNDNYAVQYGKFFINVFRADFGKSFHFNMPVSDIYFNVFLTPSSSLSPHLSSL
jgi:ABC-type dipeptide/oligopeptide/nickel transport system permease component